MKSVIIDPGIIPQDYVLSGIKNSRYTIVAIGADSNLSKIREETNCKCYSYNNFCSDSELHTLSDDARILYNKIYGDVISDYKTLQIAERSNVRLRLWENEFHDLILISKLVSGYLNVICSIKPEFVFFHSTPHEICSWTLGKVAESMGIPVYTTITSPLPWKSMLKVGLNSARLIPISVIDEKEECASYVESYYERNLNKYDKAIPSYEKKRIEARKGRFWSWRKEFLNCLKSSNISLFFYHFFAVFRKHSLYKYYQSLTDNSLDLTNKYVVVFLHYQPERTSLPEGRFFTQQYHLIKTIRMALPDDYYIYVKEHPSIFVNNLDLRYRNKSFYKDMASMHNVKLVNIGIDSFTLIDNSLSVATITGTVGVQSFIRGKSVLCFGDASYVDFDHCYNINNVEDVRRAIKRIETFNSEKISEDFHNYLLGVDKRAISGVLDNSIGDFYNQSYRLISGGKVLRYLLCQSV